MHSPHVTGFRYARQNWHTFRNVSFFGDLMLNIIAHVRKIGRVAFVILRPIDSAHPEIWLTR